MARLIEAGLMSSTENRKYTFTGRAAVVEGVKVHETVLTRDLTACGTVVPAGRRGPWIRGESNWSFMDDSFADSRYAVVDGTLRGDVVLIGAKRDAQADGAAQARVVRGLASAGTAMHELPLFTLLRPAT